MRLTRTADIEEIRPRDVPQRSMKFAADLLRWIVQVKDVFPGSLLDQIAVAAISLSEDTGDALGTSSKRSYLSHISSARQAARHLQHLLRLVEHTGLLPEGEISGFVMEAGSLFAALDGMYLKARQSLDAESREERH